MAGLVDSNEQSTSYDSPDKKNGVVKADKYGFFGGAQYTDPDDVGSLPVDVLRKRELKWLDMFENWEKWMSKRFKKVKERCRKGIPPSLRARAWQYLCGSKYLMEHNRNKFTQYLQQEGDPKCIDDIQKDLHRQFPSHEMFQTRGGYGQEDLFNVLKAYSIHNPVDGYCQAQAPLASVLLMHMPAEQAFWCLASICDKYLPGYYSPGLEAVQTDGDVLNGLIKRTDPTIYKHLKHQRVDPILYMTEWFMCVYTRTLPFASVLRVWDMFFCEGIKVIFRVALVLLKWSLSNGLKECPSLYETLQKLRKPPQEIMNEETLVSEVLRLPINERDMEKEHQYHLAKKQRAAAQAKKTTPIKSKKSKHKES